jgi:hypothetical protein
MSGYNNNNTDEIIRYFIKQVEEIDASITITLYINGQIITGKIISYSEYLNNVLQMFKLFEDYIDSKNGELMKEERSTLNRFLENTDRFIQELESRNIQTQQNFNNFIHLDKVLIYSGYGQNPLISSVWRGRISSIHAFSVGKISEIGRNDSSYDYTDQSD